MTTPIGQVFELSATDKLPGVALKTVFGVGGNLANELRYLLIVGAKAISGGTLTPDTEWQDIIADGDEVTLFGNEGCEGARMVRMARRVQGVQIKVASCSQTSTAAATAKITIEGSWTTASSGPVRFRIGGQAVEVSALADDDPTSFGDAIVDAITVKKELPVTAVNVDGEITLTAKSYGTRGNDLILWKDDTHKPSGMTITLGGDVGGTVASDEGPWILANADNLVVAFNAGGNQTFAIACTAAVKTGSGATYNAVTALNVLNLTLPSPTTGEAVQRQVVFAGTENSQALFHAAIQAVVLGLAVVTNAGGQTRITTVLQGSDAVATIDASSADVLTSLGLTASSFTNAGPNNVANANGTGVTAAEWVTICAALTNGTVEDDDGALRFTSTTTGAGGTVQIQAASTADDEMGFDNDPHTGGAGAGAAVASGGVRFSGGAATEDLTTLLETLAGEHFFTSAWSIIDATNLARLEEATDTKAGPLVRLFEQVVVGSTKAFASSTSLAQTTLNNVRFEMVDMEEGETPAEEQAAWVAAVRHQREASHPNRKYDFLPTPFVPQVAASKMMSRSRQVAALDVGLTPIPTKSNVAYISRAITTRTRTALDAADDGTIDVGQSRTPDRVNEDVGSLWLAYTDSEDTTAHHYLRNDPAPGEESDVPAGTTYPGDWQKQVTLYMKTRETQNWVTEVDDHPTVVGMHPTSSTPRFVQYTPVIVTPLTHQLEGTIAQTKFVAQ